MDTLKALEVREALYRAIDALERIELPVGSVLHYYGDTAYTDPHLCHSFRRRGTRQCVFHHEQELPFTSLDRKTMNIKVHPSIASMHYMPFDLVIWDIDAPPLWLKRENISTIGYAHVAHDTQAWSELLGNFDSQSLNLLWLYSETIYSFNVDTYNYEVSPDSIPESNVEPLQLSPQSVDIAIPSDMTIDEVNALLLEINTDIARDLGEQLSVKIAESIGTTLVTDEQEEIKVKKRKHN